jgi:hypothetical protein
MSPDGWSPADLLPGLYVAALGAGLAAALRRWFDPVPARVWAAFGLAVGALLGPALVGGRVPISLDLLERTPPYGTFDLAKPAANPGHTDLVREIAPWLAQVRAAYGAGEWPLWNPHAAAGMPQWSNPQVQVAQPFVLLAAPLPLPAAFGVTAALRLAAALVFAFLLLRRQGVGEGSATTAALAYGLSAAMLLWLGWPLGTSLAVAPALLYALVRVDEAGGRGDSILLAVAIWTLLVAGHPETELFVLLFAAVFAAARLAARRRAAGGDRRGGLRLLGRWAAAAAVAGAAAAPLLLPAAHYLPQTVRSHDVADLAAAVRRAGPLAGWRAPEARARSLREMEARLLGPLAPLAYGSTRVEHHWGPGTSYMNTAGFAGTAALLAALLAFAPGRGAPRFPQERLARWTLVVLVATAVARPPGFAWLLGFVPVLDRSGSLLQRASVLLPLLVAYLAACSFERWRRGGLDRRPLAVAAAALGAVVAWAYLAHPSPADPGALAALRHGTLAVQLAALAAAAALLAGRPAAAGRRARGIALPAALALVVAGELIAINRPLNPTTPRRLFYPEDRAVAFLRENLGGGRRMVAEGLVFPPNTSSLHGIADLRVYDPMRPWGHYLLTRAVAEPGPPRVMFHPVRLDSPVFDLLAARFALTLPGRRLGGDAPVVLRTPTCWIHRRPRALPLLFLPESATVHRGGDWAARVAAIGDFAREALVQGAPGRDQDWRARFPEAARLAIDTGGDGGLGADRRGARALGAGSTHLRAAAVLAEPRLLATSLYQDGGWRLLVDRRPHPTILANGILLAAWLPPGAPALDLVYRPPGFLAGMLLAALGLAVAASGWLRPVAARERAGLGA